MGMHVSHGPRAGRFPNPALLTLNDCNCSVRAAFRAQLGAQYTVGARQIFVT